MDPQAPHPVEGDPNTMAGRKFRRARKAVDKRLKARKKLAKATEELVKRLAEVEQTKNTLVQALGAVLEHHHGGACEVPFGALKPSPVLKLEVVGRGTPEAKLTIAVDGGKDQG